jgi:hypothetical protein
MDAIYRDWALRIQVAQAKYAGYHGMYLQPPAEPERELLRPVFGQRSHSGKKRLAPHAIRMNTTSSSITPKAIQDLLDKLEASKQSRLRAWSVQQVKRQAQTCWH